MGELVSWGDEESERYRKNKIHTDFLVHVYYWHQETASFGSMTKMLENEHYQAIIAMGPEVIPLLFERLQVSPDYYFEALRALTGEDPINPEDAGRLEAMTASWLMWAQEHGYIDDKGKIRF